MPTINAVLPISDREDARRNLDRAHLLLKSLARFWRGSDKLEIQVVCPDAELQKIGNSLSVWETTSTLRLNIRNETSVHPIISEAPPGYGVAKQMLVKLAVPEFTTSDFYLTFDTDVVACKPFDEDSLVPGGRALTEYFHYPEKYPWYLNSARLLGIPEEDVNLGSPRLFVTPAVLSVEIVKALHIHLSKLGNGRYWMKHLMEAYTPTDNSYWTEYTLYDLFSHAEGLFDSHHHPYSVDATVHCREQSIWVDDHYSRWNPSQAFNGQSPGLFMVLQSITAHGVPFDEVRERVEAAMSSEGSLHHS